MSAATAPLSDQGRRRRRPSKESAARSERNRLAESQLELARRIAADYRHRGMDDDDLRQVAYLALVKAADRFDPSRGTPFSVFASVSINGELKRHFRDHSWSIRPPRSIQEHLLTIRRAEGSLVQEFGRSPSVEEVAARTGLDADRVLLALCAKDRLSGTGTAPIQHNDGPTPEAASEDRGFDAIDDRELLTGLMARLSARDRRILRLRFADELTQEAIASIVGVSQVQVSRLIRQITETLRREAEPHARAS